MYFKNTNQEYLRNWYIENGVEKQGLKVRNASFLFIYLFW